VARIPRTNRVVRTRAGGEWTEAAFWSFLRSGLRQMSLRWPPRKHAENLSRRPYVGENKRRKWEYQCAMCKEWFAFSDTQVDHKNECGALSSFADLSVFAERLFCESDGFQVLCAKKCHKRKRKRKSR